MKIYAPVKNTNGIYASVMFVNGVGETDNPRLIEWFRSHGYKLSGGFTTTDNKSEIQVHQTDENNVIVVNDDKEYVETSNAANDNDEVELMGYSERTTDFESMEPIELRKWMMENGYGSKIRNTRNKEKLLEILRGD